MVFMDSRQDVTKAGHLLSGSAARFLGDFFDQLRELLGQNGTDKPFSLSEHGHELIFLQPMESFPDFQFDGRALEYAERIILDDVQLFKACLMEDNEGFTFLFSVVGTQVKEIEAWFADHADGDETNE
ncbi:hypothetical protein [Paenibacillus sp. NEAU-GSW1]|uniref:hypothetical protein n=1 Tax=Paenibacillus sp. NEAU-GSW1 TaxID=2682486 RepID=UPI0012E24D9C|nr:hypothetical protein [Paenibacillus sp. NEAU-GSW1]MUT64930.1 hypothetical protein [Paenibacillus sp. NEAU-GSW1]